MTCSNGVKAVAVVLDGVDCVNLFGGLARQRGAQCSIGCCGCFGVGRLAGAGGGWVSGSDVVGCSTVARRRFLGVSGGGVDDGLQDGLQVDVVGGGGSGPGSSGR